MEDEWEMHGRWMGAWVSGCVYSGWMTDVRLDGWKGMGEWKDKWMCGWVDA